jgi:hypothetical protein
VRRLRAVGRRRQPVLSASSHLGLAARCRFSLTAGTSLGSTWIDAWRMPREAELRRDSARYLPRERCGCAQFSPAASSSRLVRQTIVWRSLMTCAVQGIREALPNFGEFEDLRCARLLDLRCARLLEESPLHEILDYKEPVHSFGAVASRLS